MGHASRPALPALGRSHELTIQKEVLDISDMPGDRPKDILFSDRVRERDLDHFLIEELQASEPFRKWFESRLDEHFAPPSGTVARTRRSPQRLSDNRQTDVLLGYYDEEGQLRAALLIECKVSDGFQPGQVEAYIQELAAWRAELGSNRVATVLVAPERNSKLDSKRTSFSSFISVDDMADALRYRAEQCAAGELKERLLIRGDLLDALAGRRPSRQWDPQPIPERVELSELYDQVVRERLPGYEVTPTSAGRRADDRFFAEFPSRKLFNGRVILKHRLNEGFVCLQFGSRCFSSILSEGDFRLPSDGKIKLEWTGRTGETLQLRIGVPSLTQDNPLEVQAANVAKAIESIAELGAWFSNNVTSLERLRQTSG